VQREAEAISGEARVTREHVPRETPELVVEAVEHRTAVHAYSLHDLLIEVVEQHLAGIALATADLRLENDGRPPCARQPETRSGCQGLTRDGAQQVNASPVMALR
jgi:hypothetical protein